MGCRLFLTLIVFLYSLIGCTTTKLIKPNEVRENLSPLLALEVRINIFGRQTIEPHKLDPETAESIKNHVDVFYIYHNAAYRFLAEGNLELYEQALDFALIEIKTMEQIFKEWLQERGRLQ